MQKRAKKPNSKEQNVQRTLMGTVESNGGSKFIAGLKTKKNRDELNSVLSKYNLPNRQNRDDLGSEQKIQEPQKSEKRALYKSKSKSPRRNNNYSQKGQFTPKYHRRESSNQSRQSRGDFNALDFVENDASAGRNENLPHFSSDIYYKKLENQNQTSNTLNNEEHNIVDKTDQQLIESINSYFDEYRKAKLRSLRDHE